MSDPGRRLLHELTDEELGSALRAASSDLFPRTPPLAASVASLVGEDSRRAERPISRAGLLAAAAMLAALLVGPFFFSPALRSAAADFFGVPGIEIEVTDEGPRSEISIPELGAPTDLATARAEVPFEIRIPGSLGAPDRVLLDKEVSSGLVSLVYNPRPGLPAADETGAGLLIMQFEGRVEEALFRKVAAPGTTLELEDLNGGTAFWISGAPHPIGYLDPQGNFAESPARLAASTLLFTDEGVTFRIEGDITLQKALEIASSL